MAVGMDTGDLGRRFRPDSHGGKQLGAGPKDGPGSSSPGFGDLNCGGRPQAGSDDRRSDDPGFHIVENPIRVHDLQATILHLPGFDHTGLTFRFKGRDFRLTDVGGRVIHDILE